MPNDWHFVHLGSRAVGGAGLVIVEARLAAPRREGAGSDVRWPDPYARANV